MSSQNNSALARENQQLRKDLEERDETIQVLRAMITVLQGERARGFNEDSATDL